MKIFDIVKERSTHPLDEVATCEIVFICLPTPALPDGRCDTSAIDEFLDGAFCDGWWDDRACFVIRSTVPIGYTQRQAEKRDFACPLLHSPEFLTARCSNTDFQIPARNIIGMPDSQEVLPGRSDNFERAAFRMARLKLNMLYERRFPGVQVHTMPSNASELVKLACNTFFGAKVQLFNLFAETAKAAGVDWEDVRAGILSDGRIAHAHTAVGQGGIPGFGGTCLPKDMADLYISASNLGVDAEIIREVIERNDRIRRPFDPQLTRIELPGRDA